MAISTPTISLPKQKNLGKIYTGNMLPTKQQLGTIPVSRINGKIAVDTTRYHKPYIKKVQQKADEKSAFLANASDSHEINSAVDVIASAFNHGQFKEGYLGSKMPNIPIVQVLPNLADYLWQYNVKPITKGEFGIFGLNTLNNFNETADVISNPVKGIIIGGMQQAASDKNKLLGFFKGAGKGFIDAIGIGNDGRQQFDFDTGNKLLDIVCEVATDPTIWLSFGAEGAAKSFAKKAVPMIMGTLKDTAPDVIKNIGNEAAQSWVKETTKAAVKTALKTGEVPEKDISKLLINFMPNEAATLVTDVTRETLAKSIATASKQATENVGIKILRGLDKADDIGVKAGLGPIYGAYKATQGVHKMYNSRALRVLEPYIDKETKATKILDYDEIIQKSNLESASIINAAKENDMKLYDNPTIRKRLLKDATADYREIQKIIKANSKTPDKMIIALKNHLVTKQGFDPALDVNEMLTQYTDILKKINDDNGDFFKDITYKMTNIKNNIAYIQELNNKIDVYNKHVTAAEKVATFGNTLAGKTIGFFGNTKINDYRATAFDIVQKNTDDNFIYTTFILNAPEEVKEANKAIYDNIKKNNGVPKITDFIKCSVDPHNVVRLGSIYINSETGKILTKKELDEYKNILSYSNLFKQFKAIASNINETNQEQIANLLTELYKTFNEKHINFTNENVYKNIRKHINHSYDFRYVLKRNINYTLYRDLYAQTGTNNVKELVTYLKSSKSFPDKLLVTYITEQNELLNKYLKTGEASITNKILDNANALKNNLNKYKAYRINKAKAYLPKRAEQLMQKPADITFNGAIQKVVSDLIAKYGVNTDTINRGSVAKIGKNSSKETDLLNISSAKINKNDFEEINKLKTDIINSLTNNTKINYVTNSMVGSNLNEIVEAMFDVHNQETGIYAPAVVDAVENILGMQLNEKTSTKEIEYFLNSISVIRDALNKLKMCGITTYTGNNKKRFIDFEDLASDLEKAYNKIIKIHHKKFNITGEAVYYVTKEEYTQKSLAFIQNEITTNFIHEIASGITGKSGIYETLRDLTDDAFLDTINIKGTALTNKERSFIKEQANKVLDVCKSVVDYENLIEVIRDEPTLDAKTKSALMSSIQNISRKKVKDVVASPESTFRELIDRTNNYMKTTDQVKSLSLDTFRRETTHDFAKELNVEDDVWKQMAHHADADTLTDIQFVKENLPDIKITDKDFFVDSETTGLSGESNQILEIAVTRGDGQSVLLKRHLDPVKDAHLVPGLGTLQKLNPDTAPDDLINHFFSYYNRNIKKPQAAKNVLYFDSEAALLEAYKNLTISAPGMDTQATRMFYHNGAAFDIPFISKRAEKNGIKDFDIATKYYKTIDTLVEAQNKYGYKTLTADDKKVIRNIFDDYLAHRGEFKNLSTLRHGDEKFINAIPAELLSGLTNLRREFNAGLGFTGFEKGYNTDSNSPITKFYNACMDVLKHDILESTFEEHTTIFNKDIFDKTDFKNDLKTLFKTSTNPNVIAGIKQIIENFKNLPVNAGKVFTDAQAIDAYFDYLNASKALYASPEFINMVGYKKIWDSQIVQNWFTGLEDTIYYADMRRIYNTAKVLEQQASFINNPNAIVPYTKIIDDFLAEAAVIIHSLTNIKNQAALKLVNNIDNIANKYTLAQFFYKLIKNTDDKALEKITSLADFENVLKNDVIFKHNTILDTDLTYAEKSARILEISETKILEDYQAITNSFENIIKGYNFSGALEDKDLFRPAMQAFASSAQPCLNFMQSIVSLLAKATPKQQFKITSALIEVSDNLKLQTLRNFLTYENPEDLLHRLVYANGFTTFTSADAPDLYTKLIKNKKELEDLGMKVTYDNHRIWLQLDYTKHKVTYDVLSKNGIKTKKIYMDGVEVPALNLAELNTEQAFRPFAALNIDSSPIQKAFNETRQMFTKFTKGNSTGVHGELINKKTVRHLYEQAPEEVVVNLKPIEDLMSDTAWDSGNNFNLTNLGRLVSQRELQPNIPTDIIQSYKMSTECILKRTEAKIRFADYIAHGDTRIDIGPLAEAKNEQALLAYIKDNKDLTLCVRVLDKNNDLGYSLKSITVNNIKDLREAKRLHATLVTNGMYARAASVMNNDYFNHGVGAALAKIGRVYKVGQLSLFNIGFLMRNFIDSTAKEFLSNGDIVGTAKAWKSAITDYHKYQNTLKGLYNTSDLNVATIESIAKAYNVPVEQVLSDINIDVAKTREDALSSVIDAGVLYRKYNTAVEDIIKMDSNAVFRPDNIEFYFNNLCKDFDKETFYAVHRFITEGSSAGMPEILSKALSKLNPDFEELSGITTTANFLVNKLGAANSELEQIIRLSQHMYQMKHGMNFGESNAVISKVHFDYGHKTNITRSIEVIFPFYSFKMKNLEYWMDLVETKPWVWNLFQDMMTPIWDFDEYDNNQKHYELANNQSLQYQIMSGNLPLNSTGLTLKTNPSIMDAINMLVDPLNAAQSSLFAPLQLTVKSVLAEQVKAEHVNEFFKNATGMTDYMAQNYKPDIKSAIPLIGPTLNRFLEYGPKYYSRTGNVLNELLPSVFGATKRYKFKNYNKHKYVQKVFYPFPKRTYNKFKTKKYYHNYKKHYSFNKYTKLYYPKSFYKFYPKFDIYHYNNPRSYYDNYSRTTDRVYYNNKYTDNIYWKYYTKAGKSRMGIMMAKPTVKNLKQKIKMMYDYYR